MADDVYTNSMAALHAGSAGKALARMPDLCLSPPPPPAGPIPTPFPNNALACDIEGGATSVFFCDNPAAHIDSYVSKSTGDEPADPKASGQGNIVTHVVKGVGCLQSHSMDVLIENKAAIRHMDITTQAHASPSSSVPGTPPGPMLAKVASAEPGSVKCGEECEVVAYDKGCPKPKTPHHIIPKHCFKEFWNDANKKPIPLKGWENYNPDKAPCVCVTGSTKTTTSEGGDLLEHGWIHKRMDLMEAVAGLRKVNGKEANVWKYSEARDEGVKSVNAGTGGKCKSACLAAVLDGFHLSGTEKDPELRAYCPKTKGSELRKDALQSAARRGTVS